MIPTIVWLGLLGAQAWWWNKEAPGVLAKYTGGKPDGPKAAPMSGKDPEGATYTWRHYPMGDGAHHEITRNGAALEDGHHSTMDEARVWLERRMAELKIIPDETACCMTCAMGAECPDDEAEASPDTGYSASGVTS